MKGKKNLKVHFLSYSDEWETPKELFDRINTYFHFTLDPCATHDNHVCSKYFIKPPEKSNIQLDIKVQHDGLKQDWTKDIVFMNPPYGNKIGSWMKKAYEEFVKGATVVCLIPSRTDTTWFHEYCIHGEIYFLKGRLKFINKTLSSYNENGDFKITSAPFPSMLVVFSNKKNTLPDKKTRIKTFW